MNPKCDFFFKKTGKWQQEYDQLRMLALDTGLKEELKWGCPCYTLEGANVFLIHGFNNYCAILFHKGALMKDPKKLLIQQTENVQSARQMRFSNIREILDLAPAIKAYFKEAIRVEKSGEKVALKKPSEYKIPAEFKTRLDSFPGLKKAFEKLTPGRQRGYLLYFGSAKLAKTREERVEKNIPRILDGKGLED